jgi:hypothetical protein
MHPSSKCSVAAGNPPEGPTKSTVEQIKAAKSVPISNADDGLELKRNNSDWPNAVPFRSCPPRLRARAIQIRQNFGVLKVLAANVQVVSSLGKTIPERPTRNSAIRCVATLYAQLARELNATSKREDR